MKDYDVVRIKETVLRIPLFGNEPIEIKARMERRDNRVCRSGCAVARDWRFGLALHSRRFLCMSSERIWKWFGLTSSLSHKAATSFQTGGWRFSFSPEPRCQGLTVALTDRLDARRVRTAYRTAGARLKGILVASVIKDTSETYSDQSRPW
jgi:hypothetical protein